MHQRNTTARPRTSAPFALPIVTAMGAALFAGCSSDDSDDTGPDTTAPGFSSFVQNRTLDSTGEVVTVTFNDVVTAATAEVAGSYTISGGVNVTSATLRTGGMAVDLVLDAPAIPGDNTITVAAGLEDAAGNASVEATAQPLTSTDVTPPAATTITGTTISGPENDTIEVVFSDDMIASEVMSLANWTIESPLGTMFDATGATIAYDTMTRTAAITLDAGAADENLHTFDAIHATFITMRDIGGNTIAATTIGSGAVNAIVSGDTTPPTLLAAAPSGMDVVLTFDEDVAAVEAAELKSMANPTGTEITLTDVSVVAAPATGDLALSGAPADGDSVTISDGTTAVVFEFDFAEGDVTLSAPPADGDTISISDGVTAVVFEFDSVAASDGVGVGNVEVDNGADAALTAAALGTAINANGFNVSAADVGAMVTLTNNGTGAGGNTTITVVEAGAVFTTNDFTGGGVAVGSIPVAVAQMTPATTAASLTVAIDLNAFDVTTSSLVGAAFDLDNDNNGAAGNVAIMETDTNNAIAFNGMSGGIDAVIEGPTASTAAATPLQVTSTYSFAPAVNDTLRVYGVTDLAGNQMVPTLAETVVAINPTQPGLSLRNSDVTALTGENNDTLLVKFDAPIHPDGATDPTNFSLDDGTAVDLSNATFEFDGTDEVTITFGADSSVDIQSGDTYDLGVNFLRNVQGVQMALSDTDGGIAPGGDTTAPDGAAASAELDAANANAVIITFDEAVSKLNSVDIANYTLVGNATVDVMPLHPRAVRVTFTTQPAVADMITVAIAALTDLAGNAALGTSDVAVTAADATAPTVTGITATTGTSSGRDEIQVTFDEPVNPTQATTAANYAVSSGSAISLLGATIWMSSVGNVVNIRLAETVQLDTGEMISVTTSNVTDLAGNAIVAAASMVAIGGDAVAPAAAVGFINVKEDATGATVDVQFDETMDSTTTMMEANWTGSNSQTATSVTQLDDNLFRVVFSAPIAPADTVDVAAPTDRANNVGITITVAPIE